MNFIGEFIFYIYCQLYLVKNKFIFVPEPYIYLKQVIVVLKLLNLFNIGVIFVIIVIILD